MSLWPSTLCTISLPDHFATIGMSELIKGIVRTPVYGHQVNPVAVPLPLVLDGSI